MSYQYAQGDLLAAPQTYQYSAYQGKALVTWWNESRQSVITSLPEAQQITLPAISIEHTIQDVINTGKLLSAMCVVYRNYSSHEHTKIQNQLQHWLTVLIKKFEVSKRLYEFYEAQTPHKRASDNYQALNTYLLLAECLIYEWKVAPKSYLASTLLKICDTLCTQITHMTQQQKAQFSWVLQQEKTLLEAIMNDEVAQ